MLDSHQVYSPRGFRERTFVVTGGAHGIGRAAALALARLKAHVIVIDFDKHHLAILDDELARITATYACIHGDASKQSVIDKAVKTATSQFDGLHGWVHNAMLNVTGHIEELTVDDWNRGMEVNNTAAWLSARACAPVMPEGGAIVHISTIMAHMGSAANASYQSSKAALEGLTRSLAVELGPKHIRVNAIAPGFIFTRYTLEPQNPGVDDAVFEEYLRTTRALDELRHWSQNPIPRSGMPDDVAGAILYLLSDASSFVSGVTIMVDGGRAVWMPPQVPPQRVRELYFKLRDLYDAEPLLHKVKTMGQSPGVQEGSHAKKGHRKRRGERRRRREAEGEKE